MIESMYEPKGRETIDSMMHEWNLHSTEVCNTLNDLCSHDMRKAENRKELFGYIDGQRQYSYCPFFMNEVEKQACVNGLFKIPDFVLEYPYSNDGSDLFSNMDFIIQNMDKFPGGFKKGFYILATNVGLTEAINCKPKKMLDVLKKFIGALEDEDCRCQYADLFERDDNGSVFENALVAECFRDEYEEIFSIVKGWIV